MVSFATVAPHLAAFALGNTVVNLTIRFFARRNKNCKDVSIKRQNRAILYVLSVVNAAVGCGYGIHHYLTNSEATQTPEVLRDRAYWCVAYVTGYFCYDFMFVLPEAFTYPQDMVHHVIGMALGFGALSSIDSVYPIVPAFSLQEISTLPLNLMWFAKEFKCVGDRTNIHYVKMVFAITFLLTRIINLPWTYFDHTMTGRSTFSTGVHVAMLAFISLQLYWGVGIVKKALGIETKKKKKTKKGEAVVDEPESPAHS